jgi:hypothetical protein
MVGRGRGYTPEEDADVARAWLSVSGDAITGREQTSSAFSERVAEAFVQLRPSQHAAEARPVESIKSRWSTIQRNVQKFNGCYLATNRMKPTGSSPDGLIRLATGMYNGIHMQNEVDNCEATFKMLAAWKLLRSSPKFSGGLNRV